MSRQNWIRALWVAVEGVILFSLAMIFVPHLLHDFYTTLIYGSPDDLATGEAMPYIEFMYVVLGSVMLGWAISMGFWVRLLAQGEAEAWNALAISMGIWFVIDTSLSLYLGFWQNGALNVPFLLMFALPLAALRRNPPH